MSGQQVTFLGASFVSERFAIAHHVDLTAMKEIIWSNCEQLVYILVEVNYGQKQRISFLWTHCLIEVMYRHLHFGPDSTSRPRNYHADRLVVDSDKVCVNLWDSARSTSFRFDASSFFVFRLSVCSSKRQKKEVVNMQTWKRLCLVWLARWVTAVITICIVVLFVRFFTSFSVSCVTSRAD